MDGLNIDVEQRAEKAQLVDIGEVEAIRFSILNSVASEVVDAFKNKDEREKIILFQGKEVRIGDFVVDFLKANNLTSVMQIMTMIVSQKESLTRNPISADESYAYIAPNARIKEFKNVEFDLASSPPGNFVTLIGNGQVQVFERAFKSQSFLGSFVLGSLINIPPPYNGTSTKVLKMITSNDIIEVTVNNIKYEVPLVNVRHLWLVAQGKAGPSSATRKISGIPWLTPGDKPSEVSAGLNLLFTNLAAVCKNFAEDEIVIAGKKEKGWTVALSWVVKNLTTTHTKENPNPINVAYVDIAKKIWVFDNQWKDQEQRAALLQTNDGMKELATLRLEMPSKAAHAGQVMDLCRAVRGRDNPNVEYSPWTLFEHLPWGLLSLLKHKMFCEGKNFKPTVILRTGVSDQVFVGTKVINLENNGWVDALKEYTLDPNSKIFCYAENVHGNNYFQRNVTKNESLDEISAEWHASDVLRELNYSRTLVSRISLPYHSKAFELFIADIKILLSKGRVNLFPSVTVHNLECYLTFIPGVDKLVTPEVALGEILAVMYDMYNASIAVNWARTVCYCLMIPGNVGKPLFCIKKARDYMSRAKLNFSGDFHIDPNNKSKVYVSQLGFESADEVIRTEMEGVDLGSGKNIAKRPRIEKEANKNVGVSVDAVPFIKDD